MKYHKPHWQVRAAHSTNKMCQTCYMWRGTFLQRFLQPSAHTIEFKTYREQERKVFQSKYGKLVITLRRMKARDKAIMKKHIFSCCAFICKCNISQQKILNLSLEMQYHLNWLSIIVLLFCQRQSPASHVLQKIISCQNVCVKKCMELLSERILDVFIGPWKDTSRWLTIRWSLQGQSPCGDDSEASLVRLLDHPLDPKHEVEGENCLGMFLTAHLVHDDM